MLRLIIEKELREILRSTKFSVSFALCSLLIVLAFWAGAVEYKAEATRHEAAKKGNLRQLEGLTDWLMVTDFRIFLPPQPLASLVSGISNDIGRTTPIGGRGDSQQDDSKYNEEPVYAAFRFLDLEYILQLVLSLFALLFTFDAISGEKERGTLRLTFAGPLKRSTYMSGKLIGSFLALGIPLIVPFLMGALLLVLLGVPMAVDEWLRLGCIIGTGLLYLAAFMTIGIAVSSMTRRSSNSFLVLLVVWIFAVLIIPRSAVLLAGRSVDVPSVDAIGAQMARFGQQQATEDQKKMAGFQSTSEPQKAIQEFQKFMGDISANRAKKTQELSMRLNEQRANRQVVQEALALGLARLSPAASFSLAATTFAGTSLRLKERYRDAAREYKGTYDKFMLEKTGVNPGGGMVMRIVTDDSGKRKPIDPQEMPPFVYRHATLADVGADGIIDVGILAAFCLVFFAVAHIAFVRYDLR
jgi:ABC-type transport system involved in multi-copper enzyme maturation permease subunit